MRRAYVIGVLLLVVTIVLAGACATHTEGNGRAEWSKYTCKLPTGKEKTSIDQASSVAGWDVPLPVPTYLPDGCDIKEVYAEHGKNSRIFLIISDKEIERKDGEFSCVMLLQVSWHPTGFPGLKLVGGPLQDRGDHYSLWWHLPEGATEWGQYEMVLSVNKDFPTEELYKVRDHVQY